jgi:hypothetical protein
MDWSEIKERGLARHLLSRLVDNPLSPNQWERDYIDAHAENALRKMIDIRLQQQFPNVPIIPKISFDGSTRDQVGDILVINRIEYKSHHVKEIMLGI